jgi:hypothetical protein
MNPFPQMNADDSLFAAAITAKEKNYSIIRVLRRSSAFIGGFKAFRRHHSQYESPRSQQRKKGSSAFICGKGSSAFIGVLLG